MESADTEDQSDGTSPGAVCANTGCSAGTMLKVLTVPGYALAPQKKSASTNHGASTSQSTGTVRTFQRRTD